MIQAEAAPLDDLLYRPEFEHDGCGTGFVAEIGGHRSHSIVEYALTALTNLTHRGAVDADAKTGDGAGLLTQIPYAVLNRSLTKWGVRLDNPYDLGVGMTFLPRKDRKARDACREIVESAITDQNLTLFGWRKVPVDRTVLGDKAALTEPLVYQVLVGRPRDIDDAEFERRLYLVRRRSEYHARLREFKDFYLPSFSHRTVVYKGLFVGPQLGRYYRDLHDPKFLTAMAVFHQRYSTNTFPNWFLAQPFRFIAHNGEINTLKGNVAWMRAREANLDNDTWNGRLSELGPVIDPEGSDSAKFDNAVDLYVQSGRSLPHALMMMVPEAHEAVPLMDENLRGFYRYHECLTEAWDGPAAMAFSDGVIVGALLDRNGLRPARFKITDDDLMVMGSEVGILELDDRHVIEKGRLGPGQMVVVNTKTRTVRRSNEVKRAIATGAPYRVWAESAITRFTRTDECFPRTVGAVGSSGWWEGDRKEVQRRQLANGYSKETIEVVMRPMVETGKEPLGSMGDDTPLAVLSQRTRLLYGYFKQLFAQVTNPPIDHLREELVMSLTTYLGARGNVLTESPDHAKLVALVSPILTPAELERLTTDRPGGLVPWVLSARFRVAEGTGALESALRQLESVAAEKVRAGHNLIILSHRDVNAEWAGIPMLLAVGAVHHHLIRQGRRMAASIVADADDASEVHHVAALIGYGADVVVPRLAFAVVSHLIARGEIEGADEKRATRNYRHSIDEGLRKIMSKMGISLISSYRGAQIFEALGLHPDVVAECFAGTPSRIGGISYERIAEDVLEMHRRGYPEPAADELSEEGIYRYRRALEYHGYNPDVFKALHRAVRANNDRGDGQLFREFLKAADDRPPTNIRDLLEFASATPVPVEEVEPAEGLVKRFTSGAMSFGALSREAHTTIAIAMNRIGAKSDSGEGGEDPDRFHRLPNGDLPSSMIKQVASARFGVTPEYLASAKELEIKMAQGSKPGEGGQLPGHKVSEEIARVRHATPWVTLISPPPHHDIYSIEDLAQLIYDLKHANTRAKVAVKLVAEAGIGTIAAGVAKAFADTIHISGCEGGTGASPLSSIKHAGLPWELGLAETQQVLVLNGLRGRVTLRVDGGLKTGRDVVIAAMLGAEEYGFGTIALIAAGCVMARQCHLNTCPVGVASQREDLRKRFPGKPEHVVNFMLGVAHEVRSILASLGARTMDEIIGRVDMLRPRSFEQDSRWAHLDLRRILAVPDPSWTAPRRHTRERNDRSEASLDDQILQDARDVIRGREGPIMLQYPIRNVHRAVGTKLAGEIAYEHGDAGLPEGSIECRFEGTAGQSFGAFCIDGLRLILTGEANDYVGKGMHGGELIVTPAVNAAFKPHENVIVGNTVLYGATGGILHIAGRAGERFAVRNSGATAVVEGVGDHGCEYMTGGTVVSLGGTGRNFGAGMTGGVAYVYDERGDFADLFNPQLVDISHITTNEDADRLWELISRHVLWTHSQRGRAILDTWDRSLPRFWRVAPHRAEPVQEPPKRPGEKVRHRSVVEVVEGEHPEAHVGSPTHPVGG